MKLRLPVDLADYARLLRRSYRLDNDQCRYYRTGESCAPSG
jgi:hypothetical protein